MDVLLMDALDLKIYDESGKLVTYINHNVKTKLELDTSKFTIINAFLNIELLKSINDNGEDNSSDFEKELNKKSVIKFKKKPSTKYYKIIAEGLLITDENGTKEYSLVIHKAVPSYNSNLTAETGVIHNQVMTFNLFTTNDESEDYVDLVLK